ncbi:MAG: ABC transporter permease subunit [Natrialbaceae archaeon]|nr:ABC transporter permease subunit [Natrialbaceae archaeon]
MKGLANALGRVARIARWEVTRSAGTIERRTLLIVLLMVGLSTGVGLFTLDSGVGVDDDIYRVAVDDESPYMAVVEADNRFRQVSPGSAAALHIQGPEIRAASSRTGPPAYDAFREAIVRYNRKSLAAEPDQDAAFPVLVSLEYRGRATSLSTAGPVTDTDTEPDGSEEQPSPSTGESLNQPFGTGAGDATSPSQTPGALSPPFPFESLILAFLFVVPMNFVIQAYGSTIMDERINRRGELLLVSPASRYEIVAGKTLPYFLGLIGVIIAIAALIGGGPLSVGAAIPIALVFLATTFVGGMLARSFKELTFVTVAISVYVTTYTFVPAIFTEITPIALISPLTIVVMDLQGQPVSALAYLFSTGPFYLAATVLGLLGIGIYREEDMFTQKSVPAKAIDAVASRITGRRSIAILPILFIPFVLAGQLFVVGLLFAAPASVAIPLVLIAAAGIEEVIKSVAIYAGFARRHFLPSRRGALILGGLAGAGFFVGEKLTQVVQLVGLPELEVARAAFGPALEADPLVLLALFLAPLALHIGTATIAALGARRGPKPYVIGVVLATLVHMLYNLGVLYVTG